MQYIVSSKTNKQKLNTSDHAQKLKFGISTSVPESGNAIFSVKAASGSPIVTGNIALRVLVKILCMQLISYGAPYTGGVRATFI